MSYLAIHLSVFAAPLDEINYEQEPAPNSADVGCDAFNGDDVGLG